MQDNSSQSVSAGKGKLSGTSGQSRFNPSVEALVSAVLDIGQDLELLASLVTAKKQEVLAHFKGSILLSRQEAADRLELSLSQLDRETGNGALPVILIDRRPRYCLADIETFISSRRSTQRRRATKGRAKGIAGSPSSAAPPRNS